VLSRDELLRGGCLLGWVLERVRIWSRSQIVSNFLKVVNSGAGMIGAGTKLEDRADRLVNSG